MKVTNINGGLGNQLFQYFFGKKIIGKKNENIFLANDIKNYNSHQGLEINKLIKGKINLLARPSSILHDTNMKRFFNKISHLNNQWFKSYYEKPGTNITADQIAQNSFFYGYWQDINYFEPIRNEIISEIVFKLDKKNHNYISFIKKSKLPISIHVRRGDYLKSSEHENLSINYYKNAIKYVQEKYDHPKFFIFSDDLKWCKTNLSEIIAGDKEYVDINIGSDSFMDMKLMSECNVNIIANSTFSWWSSFLNRNDLQEVIVPKRWFVKKENFLYTKQMKKIL